MKNTKHFTNKNIFVNSSPISIKMGDQIGMVQIAEITICIQVMVEKLR